MPFSALPPHLRDIENNFPDDSQYGTKTLFGKIYKWYNKTTKTWFAFSYRCTEWWARWRKFPIVLFGMKGAGPWRFEHETGDFVNESVQFIQFTKVAYLSRVQYFTRWHIAIQWPFMISFHFYPKAQDVPIYRPDQRVDSKALKGKVWFAYWNHFDADLVYWMLTSAYLGRNWK